MATEIHSPRTIDTGMFNVPAAVLFHGNRNGSRSRGGFASPPPRVGSVGGRIRDNQVDDMVGQRFKAAVFVDRDGTIIEDAHYLSDPGRVRLLPGVGPAVAALNREGIAAVLVTNQSGVARGFFQESAVRAVHDRLMMLLALDGAKLDGIYFCPHLETADADPYRLACRCRKPAPGMVEQARKELGLSGLPTYVIGDKAEDLELARAVGAVSVLVRSGHGTETESKLTAGSSPPDLIVNRFSEAIDWVLERT